MSATSCLRRQVLRLRQGAGARFGSDVGPMDIAVRPRDPRPMARTTVAAVASSRVEAQLIAGMLEANGIAATILADDAGGQEPQWQLTDGVRVIVADEDLADAQRLLAADDG